MTAALDSLSAEMIPRFPTEITHGHISIMFEFIEVWRFVSAEMSALPVTAVLQCILSVQRDVAYTSHVNE